MACIEFKGNRREQTQVAEKAGIEQRDAGASERRERRIRDAPYHPVLGVHVLGRMLSLHDHVLDVPGALRRALTRVISNTKEGFRTTMNTTNIPQQSPNAKPVLVTTERRGVFFGYLENHDKEQRTVTLSRIRCAIRWRTTGGFLELATVGPNSNSKIGTMATKTDLGLVTSITECTPEAAQAWEEHK